jgi:hypothetical protein
MSFGVGHIVDGYVHAVEQLESVTIDARLSAIRTLEQLAHSSCGDHVVEILSAFTRVHGDPSHQWERTQLGPTRRHWLLDGSPANAGTWTAPPISPPADVQAAVTVLGRLVSTSSRGDLSGAYLCGAVLTGADFSRSTFTGAGLAEVDFTDADLSGAVLADADLTHAVLVLADLSGADLTGADLTRADLTGADLTGADLTGAVMVDAILADTTLVNTNLAGADLSNACLVGAKLSGARLSGATVVDIDAGAPTRRRTSDVPATAGSVNGGRRTARAH